MPEENKMLHKFIKKNWEVIYSNYDNYYLVDDDDKIGCIHVSPSLAEDEARIALSASEFEDVVTKLFKLATEDGTRLPSKPVEYTIVSNVFELEKSALARIHRCVEFRTLGDDDGK